MRPAQHPCAKPASQRSRDMAENDPTNPAPPTVKKRTNPLVLFLMAVIPAAAIVWAMYQTQVKKPIEQNQQLNSELVYNLLGRPGESAPLKLADSFKDADG